MSEQRPIITNSNTTGAQVIAGVRQALLSVGAILTAFGFSGAGMVLGLWADRANDYVVVAGLALWIVNAILGQIHVRKAEKAKAALEPYAPDPVAMTAQDAKAKGVL